MQKNQVDQDLYIVEKIIGKKTVKDKVFFKVKWLGYSEQECTWEKRSHLRYVPALVEEFESQEAAFANTMKSPPCSVEDSLSDGNIQRNASDGERGSHIAMRSKQSKKVPRANNRVVIASSLENNQSSYQNKDNTSEGSSQTFSKKKPRAIDSSKEGGKKLQKVRKVSRKKLQASKKMINTGSSRPSASKLFQSEPKTLKGEEATERDDYKEMQIVIRLLEPAEGESLDVHDYVVIYKDGKSKIFNTWELFYAHPVEFVGYLEKKAKRK